ncbi:uncharacterized protein osm [Carassius carassius]|uniref:uncharacterized protein osm n=1 Tax=Carassius carassius TaxID=217509 RepID=UPI0028692A62|nr:uncharacterized protein osm [Carassius carassius]
MELKTGLLIWWILMMSQEMTCRPTNRCLDRINYTKPKIEHLLKKFLSEKENDVKPWPNPISELHLKNLSREEKMQKAQCGLHFMHEALQLIHQHLSDLHDSTNPILEEIEHNVKALFLTKHCVAEVNCTRIPEPDFPFKDTYRRKQWARTVLQTSVEFLGDMVNGFLDSTKRPLLKHA